MRSTSSCCSTRPPTPDGCHGVRSGSRGSATRPDALVVDAAVRRPRHRARGGRRHPRARRSKHGEVGVGRGGPGHASGRTGLQGRHPSMGRRSACRDPHRPADLGGGRLVGRHAVRPQRPEGVRATGDGRPRSTSSPSATAPRRSGPTFRSTCSASARRSSGHGRHPSFGSSATRTWSRGRCACRTTSSPSDRIRSSATCVAGSVTTALPFCALHQATDPDRFHPEAGGPPHELLFVGNSRHRRRAILDALAGTTHDLAVYGGNWTADLLDLRYLRGEWIPNDGLRRHYSSADIVLNDSVSRHARRGFHRQSRVRRPGLRGVRDLRGRGGDGRRVRRLGRDVPRPHRAAGQDRPLPCASGRTAWRWPRRDGRPSSGDIPSIIESKRSSKPSRRCSPLMTHAPRLDDEEPRASRLRPDGPRRRTRADARPSSRLASSHGRTRRSSADPGFGTIRRSMTGRVSSS